MTCKECGNQFRSRKIKETLDDAVQKIKEELRMKNINLGISLCPDCYKRSTCEERPKEITIENCECLCAVCEARMLGWKIYV
jgi:hypothetical protein